MTEEWRSCTVDDGYEVSSLGRVRAITRPDFRNPCYRASGFIRILKPHPMKATLLSTGYLQVSLSNRRKHAVHRLVALAFIPNPENKKHVNHKNGNRADNALVNLEWATASENAEHSFRVLGRKVANDGKGKLIEYRGQAKTIREWSNETGLPITMIHCRLLSGWTPDRALTTRPLKGKNSDTGESPSSPGGGSALEAAEGAPPSARETESKE